MNVLLYNYRLLYIPYARNSSNSLAAYLYRDKVKRLVRTTRPSRAPHPYNDPSIEAPQHLTQTRSPGRTSCTDTARPACFTKAEAGCFTSARSPSTITASIFCLNCLRKGSMSACVVR